MVVPLVDVIWSRRCRNRLEAIVSARTFGHDVVAGEKPDASAIGCAIPTKGIGRFVIVHDMNHRSRFGFLGSSHALMRCVLCSHAWLRHAVGESESEDNCEEAEHGVSPWAPRYPDRMIHRRDASRSALRTRPRLDDQVSSVTVPHVMAQVVGTASVYVIAPVKAVRKQGFSQRSRENPRGPQRSAKKLRSARSA
jgi:hypothetical protein